MARCLSLAACLVLGATLAQAATIQVLPMTGHNRDWMNMPEATDDQPTWNGTMPANVTTDEYEGVEAYADRYAYLDLGDNWATYRITEVWTRYRDWSTGDVRCFQDYAWATSFDSWNFGGLTPETQIKFSTQIALPYSDQAQWMRDVDLNASPVTPAGRYLVIHSMNPAGTNLRASEFAMVGYTEVPEPTSLAAIGLAGLLLLKRRPA